MQPINYVEALNRHYGSQGNPPYQWTVNTGAPLHKLSKPLNDCTVSLLTSGGVSKCAMPAFNPDAMNDHRLDAISSTTPAGDFQIHDSYYDHSDAESDINCLFPLQRLRELQQAGEIAAVAQRLWSGFMGRIYNRSKVLEDSGPRFADALAADGVDVLVAAPSWPLDHQTVGLVCRLLEERGIATVYVATGRDLTAQVVPPRALFVNHPMGNNFGRPHKPEEQTQILRSALRMIHEVTTPGELIDYPLTWHADFAYAPGGQSIV